MRFAMDLSQISMKRLRMFLAVVAEGNIARTAKTLGTSQPSLSRQIALLERDVGTQLFVRDGRGVSPTRAGSAFATHAAQALQIMERAADAVAEIGGEIGGEVRLGLPPTVAHILAVPLIALLRDHFPGVGVTVMEGYSGHVLEWLSKGRLDLGVLYATGHTSDLPADILYEEELHLILPPGPGRPADGVIRGREISRLDLILPSPAHGLRQLVESRFSAAGIPLRIAMQVDAFNTTRSLVEKGRGCTILPSVAVREMIETGRLRALRIIEPDLRRKVMIATSPAAPPSKVVRALATFARRHFHELLHGQHPESN